VRNDDIIFVVVQGAPCANFMTQRYAYKNKRNCHRYRNPQSPLPHFPNTPRELAALSLFPHVPGVKGILSSYPNATLKEPGFAKRNKSTVTLAEKKTPGRWGERPGWGLLLRGAGRNLRNS